MVFECNGVEVIRLEFEWPLRLEHLFALIEEIADRNKVDISAVTIRFVESTEKEEPN